MDWTENYQPVEYIESTGTQYINTNIIPTDTMGIYMRLSSSDISTDSIYFGSRKETDTRFWAGNYSSKLYFGWNTITPSDSRPQITADQAFDIELNYMNSRVKKYNNNYAENITTALSSTNTIPISIFAGNNNGTTICESIIKLYEFKVSNNSDIIHDFIPCIRRTDGVAGLYDKVSGVFYTNAGSGNFTVGPVEYTTSTTMVTTADNHTLYATWKQN